MLEDKREEKRDRGREEEGLQMCTHNWTGLGIQIMHTTFICPQLPDQLWDEYDESVHDVTIAFLESHEPVKRETGNEESRKWTNLNCSNVYRMSLMGRRVARI